MWEGCKLKRQRNESFSDTASLPDSSAVDTLADYNRNGVGGKSEKQKQEEPHVKVAVKRKTCNADRRGLGVPPASDAAPVA